MGWMGFGGAESRRGLLLLLDFVQSGFGNTRFVLLFNLG